MISRDHSTNGKADIWSRLAEPVDKSTIAWRQDGKVAARDGKFWARFVAYIEANTVRERLDSVVPGEWDLTLELLPPAIGEDEDKSVSFKARLQILGVIREDVGSGKDYKQAATDAFKRAGVRFGIAHELYAYEQNWVQVDSDQRFAKPIEDPGLAYARRFGNGGASANGPSSASPVERDPAPAPKQEIRSRTVQRAEPEDDGGHEHEPNGAGIPSCPKCGGMMWDNRLSKRNPKAPDYKCRDRSCDGVVWPPRNASTAKAKDDHAGQAFDGDPGPSDLPPPFDSSPLGMSVDDIPF